MDKMYEYFKAVKRSHSYLLLSCFLSIAISLSITDTSNINKAINEVEAFQDFSTNQINTNPLNLLDIVLTQDDKNILKSVSNKFHHVINKYKNFNFGISSDYNIPGVNPVYRFNKEYNNKSLTEILLFIEILDDKEIVFLYPDLNDFEIELKSFLENLDQEKPKYIEFKIFNYNYQLKKIEFPASVFHNYDKEKDIKTNEKENKIYVKLKSKTLNYSWLDLLFKHNIMNEFVKKDSDDDYTIFPYLKLYWQNIKDVNPSSSIERLKEIRASIPSQYTITLFGFGIDLSPMKYIGQIVIVLLFLYYYLHLSYVEMKKPDKQTIEYFPWISIYKGKLPIYVTWFFTFILPSLSVTFIFLGFYSDNFSDNSYSLIISIIAIVFLIWMGVLTNKILINLRNEQK